MTQRDRVKGMLEAAGEKGLRSDAFLEARIPRAAARIGELKDQGFVIESTREAQFCRYTLRKNVGVEAGSRDASQPRGQGGPENRGLSLDSSVERGPVSPSPPTRPRSARNMYSAWEEP